MTISTRERQINMLDDHCGVVRDEDVIGYMVYFDRATFNELLRLADKQGARNVGAYIRHLAKNRIHALKARAPRQAAQTA
jgi:hypothetical protein